MTEDEICETLFWAYNGVWFGLVLLMSLNSCAPEPCAVQQIVEHALHVYCDDG